MLGLISTGNRRDLLEKKKSIYGLTVAGFWRLLQLAISWRLKSHLKCVKRDILQMTKSYLCTNSLSFRGKSDSSLSGRRRDQKVHTPRERNSQGSVPASRTPVVEHNDTHPCYQSIHVILKLKCIRNCNSLPYLVYCTSSIHSLTKKRKKGDRFLW